MTKLMINDQGGASLGDNRISCGVHLFDDPKSGAPYVVPLPDTGGGWNFRRTDLQSKESWIQNSMVTGKFLNFDILHLKCVTGIDG